MIGKITPAMQTALRGLKERGGSGFIDRVGRVVASGEIVGLYHGDHLSEATHSVTWARMMTFGLVEPDGPGRVRISTAGLEVLAPRRKARS